MQIRCFQSRLFRWEHPYSERGDSYGHFDTTLALPWGWGVNVGPRWPTDYNTYLKRLVTVQKKAIKIITNTNYNSHSDPLFKKTNILKLDNPYERSVSKYMFALNNGTLPINLANAFFQNRDIHRYNTRNKLNPHIQSRRTNIASRNIKHRGPDIWCNIPNEIKTSKLCPTSFDKYKLYSS